MSLAAFNLETYSQIVAAYYGIAGVTIRPARKADFPRLAEIQVQALCNSRLGRDGPHLVQRYIERHLRQTLALCQSPTFFVATNDETVIGCGGWTDVSAEAGSLPCAVAFYVDPSHSGRKIGRSLLAVSEASAKKSGVDSLLAFVPQGVTAMFRNAGYSAGDIVPYDLGHSLAIELQLMRKWLSH
ncbi:GNAT family N-acetyltransferase [Kaistia granuli]|uniref:GNAT family N-acetyltransferase n=1 Tax=Kaistia granuli TaxID=363259 RepID=UPI000367B795|nr:GNAT family N-acetyltransferase [Kaistia granuli]